MGASIFRIYENRTWVLFFSLSLVYCIYFYYSPEWVDKEEFTKINERAKKWDTKKGVSIHVSFLCFQKRWCNPFILVFWGIYKKAIICCIFENIFVLRAWFGNKEQFLYFYYFIFMDICLFYLIYLLLKFIYFNSLRFFSFIYIFLSKN